MCGLVQGFGMGFVFIPLSTVAFLTLPAQLRTDGTAMLTLVRNVASSVGISVVIANLSQQDDGVLQPARRAHHAVQRRAAKPGRRRAGSISRPIRAARSPTR